ncbi:type IV pilus assembly protein PilM [Patescibacteria group bacterium]|nr:type IV pilus assembly protein PilM [Patescibacteria group bacterium]
MVFDIIRESFNNLPAFGLDFSDRSIKVMQLYRDGKRIKILSSNRRKIPSGLLVDGEIKDADGLVKEIHETLKTASPFPIKNKETILSLPESKCFIKVIKMPKLNIDEIEETIRFKAEEYFPLNAEEMYLDWRLLDTTECPISNKGDCTDILVAVASKNIVESYLEVMDKSDLIPVVFEAESVATTRALLRDEAYTTGSVLIVDLGNDRTSFIFYKYPTLKFTQSIPVSGEKFTLAVAKGFKISFQKAEKMKYELGLSRDSEAGEKVYELLLPLMEDLVSNISKSIDYYNDYFGTSSKEDFKIVICGGGANLRSIDTFLSKVLDKSVEFANPWREINATRLIGQGSAARCRTLFYTTALGLSLYNLSN